jgi:hypothetical protein
MVSFMVVSCFRVRDMNERSIAGIPVATPIEVHPDFVRTEVDRACLGAFQDAFVVA